MRHLQFRQRFRHLACASLVALAILGCSTDVISNPEATDPRGVFHALTLEHEAIVLSTHAPYDTVQLRAVPRNIYGEPLPYEGRFEYRRFSLLDTTVSVDSTGLVKAKVATTSTRVEVRLTIGTTTRTDTATIMVRNELPVRKPTRLEFFPLAPDSNWRWAGSGAGINYESWVRLFDATGAPMANNQAVIAYSWGNDLVVNSLTAAVGETYIYARVYAYGTALVDSTIFRRVEPSGRFMVIGREVPIDGAARHRFFPDSIEVKTGTTIIFMNANGNLGVVTLAAFCQNTFCGNRVTRTQNFPNSRLEFFDSTDVVFDRPDLVSAGRSFLTGLGLTGFPTTAFPADGGVGNISAFSLSRCIAVIFPSDRCGGRTLGPGGTVDPGYRSRAFHTPGTYRFHSTRFAGATGIIVVKD